MKKFSRYHKYTHGAAMRESCLQIMMLIVKANNSRDKTACLEELRVVLEQLKVQIRICKEIKASPDFKSFEISINQVIQVSK